MIASLLYLQLIFSIRSFSILLVQVPILITQSDASVHFYCGNDANDPATIAQHPTRGEVVFVRWVKDYGGWNTHQRCQHVSKKFEANYKNGSLNYVVPGWADVETRGRGYPVLCASKEKTEDVIPCPNDRVLVTLRKDAGTPNETVANLWGLDTQTNVAQVNHASSSSGVEKSGNIWLLNTSKQLLVAPKAQGCEHFLFGCSR